MIASEPGIGGSPRPIAVVVSLKFHAGHFSHLVALYRLLAESGFAPCLYVHPAFNALDESNEYRKVNTGAALARLGRISVAVFCFPDARNMSAAAVFRFRDAARVIYIFHEPLEPLSTYRAAGFSTAYVTKLLAINAVNIVVLWFSDVVILPSRKALRRYEESYRFLRKVHCRIPLLFDDEASGFGDRDKTSISYIGTIAPDHAFDRFVEFATLAMSNLWFPEYKFAIATASTLSDSVRHLVTPFIASGQMVVTEGRPLSTRQINEVYASSAVVWNAYNRSMQSGVLPKAYMFGAAVIAAACNSNEYVVDGDTGVIVDANADMHALRQGVSRILRDRARYSEACREMFCRTFYYRNWASTFLDEVLEQRDPG